MGLAHLVETLPLRLEVLGLNSGMGELYGVTWKQDMFIVNKKIQAKSSLPETRYMFIHLHT